MCGNEPLRTRCWLQFLRFFVFAFEPFTRKRTDLESFGPFGKHSSAKCRVYDASWHFVVHLFDSTSVGGCFTPPHLWQVIGSWGICFFIFIQPESLDSAAWGVQLCSWNRWAMLVVDLHSVSRLRLNPLFVSICSTAYCTMYIWHMSISLTDDLYSVRIYMNLWHHIPKYVVEFFIWRFPEIGGSPKSFKF